MENWKLTDEELARLTEMGGNAQVAQAQEKAMFVANGGVILNPDALSDLYEALKKIKSQDFWLFREDIKAVREALAKAEGK